MTIADRKTVWAALPDDETWIVAGAQGWMDVLVGERKLVDRDETSSPPLGPLEVGTMRDTFRRLEIARETLAEFMGRDFAPFSRAGVLEQLVNCETVDELLTRDCSQAGADQAIGPSDSRRTVAIWQRASSTVNAMRSGWLRR